MSTGMNAYFLEENCDYTLKSCNWLGVEGENCAQEYCNGYPSTSGTCPGIGLDPRNCCGSSNAATCLNTWYHGSSGSTGSGSSGDNTSNNPCASVVKVIISCSTANPSLFPSGSIYTAGPIATEAASCLCYDSNGTYDPSSLDENASKCVASGSAAHPTYYPYASVLDGFCSNVAGPASTAAALTTTALTGLGIVTSGATVTSAAVEELGFQSGSVEITTTSTFWGFFIGVNRDVLSVAIEGRVVERETCLTRTIVLLFVPF
ncbi:uncharacterized protein N7477_004869 [Penicillium maclennaniae]|uniref:uncharacterized protein n=1 Tax=Penicillium maclennaniae TaxID=1343394 RepID=UPI002540342C|nr:uncharacterized protein N7477_004869 [Penicillium maclennaniae]KAJ5674935.1 hypothetical protein N7477_004869 [Penicillium maclennaniae]